jgi:hypothetical protein
MKYSVTLSLQVDIQEHILVVPFFSSALLDLCGLKILHVQHHNLLVFLDCIHLHDNIFRVIARM